jgi:hypothetical protein
MLNRKKPKSHRLKPQPKATPYQVKSSKPVDGSGGGGVLLILTVRQRAIAIV